MIAMPNAKSEATEHIWQPGCMRCDQLCLDGKESPCQGCGAIARQASNVGNAASGDHTDPALHGSALIHGGMEPMGAGGVQLLNLHAATRETVDKKMLEINCCGYQDPKTGKHWWSCSHNTKIWFMIASKDAVYSECRYWEKTMSPMWTNTSQGYVLFEEAPASKFVIDDGSDGDSELNDGAIEPTAEPKTGKRWWSYSHNARIWFTIASKDAVYSECGYWEKTMSAMWTNTSQGYVFFEEAHASKFVIDDGSDGDSELNDGVIEPTATQKGDLQMSHSYGTSGSSFAPLESGGTGGSPGDLEYFRGLHAQRFDIGEERRRLEEERDRIECQAQELENAKKTIEESLSNLENAEKTIDEAINKCWKQKGS